MKETKRLFYKRIEIDGVKKTRRFYMSRKLKQLSNMRKHFWDYWGQFESRDEVSMEPKSAGGTSHVTI